MLSFPFFRGNRKPFETISERFQNDFRAFSESIWRYVGNKKIVMGCYFGLTPIGRHRKKY
jgi:hypothetical protein